MSFLLRALSIVLQKLIMALRWTWYNLRVFIWHRPAPVGTRFYGPIQFSHLPCRIELGRDCVLGEHLLLAPGRNATIVLGDGSSINRGSVLVASERITIGKRVAIAEYVSIRDQEHIHVPGIGVRDQGFTVAPVEIGDFSWIGRNSYLGPGTKIGRNCIVGANSVVRGEFPDGVLIAGAPAKIKKYLNPEDEGHLPTPHSAQES
ncbi:acyltransferase [Aurantiacibacter marinus]|uniref:acyltransferase n=1 Tax=Aurantiacibacter marinus TaxID=874156 RepID=UPI0006994060|nr:acyltransferase [Aurantiacibacter marinus]